MFTAMDIMKPLTPDGMCGWTKTGVLVLWERRGETMSGQQIEDTRGFICKICQQGWVLTCESLKDQYRNRYREWVHYSCFIRILAMEDRDLFYDSLVDAHIRFSELQEVPSRYWINDPIWSKRSWCVTQALDQLIRITLGSRKRVYNIEFESLDGSLLKGWETAASEFHQEDVTKEFGPKRLFLHAWGGVQLKDFLKRLSSAFGLDKREAMRVP